MPRALKTFSQVEPQNLEVAKPKANMFTLDLAGLDLTPDQLEQVRQEAVKGAMVAAAGLLGDRVAAMDGFATFSTFSTFSTFGSGAARPELIRTGLDRAGIERLPTEVQTVINRVLPGR
jgi:hypothetical protein